MTSDRISRQDVEELLATLLVEVGGVARDRIHSHSTIESDLQLESVAFLEVQVALEDELGVEIDPIRIVELNELRAIAEYIHSLTTDHQ